MSTFGSNRERPLRNPPSWGKPEPAPEGDGDESSALAELNVKDVAALVAEAETEEQLADYEAQELAGKGRRGVIDAIEARRDELEESDGSEG